MVESRAMRSPRESGPTRQQDLGVAQLGWLAAAVFVVSAGYGALMPLIPDWLRPLMGDADPAALARHVGYLSGIYTAGILLGAAMLVALMLVPIVGSTVNGAKRWINLGMSLQPSEFLKPSFAIGVAWILSWRARDPKIPVIAIATGLMALIGGLLMLQPDFGSTVLFGGVWFVMILMCGLPIKRIAMAIGAGIGAVR